MNKTFKALCFSAGLLSLAVSSAQAQTMRIIIENDTTFLRDGTGVSKENAAALEFTALYGQTSDSLAALLERFSGLTAGLGDEATVDASVAAMRAALTPLTWTAIPTASLEQATFDTGGSIPLSPGNRPVVVLTTAADPLNLVAGDQIAVLGTTTSGGDFGQIIYSWGSAANTFQVLVGNPGSVNLVTVIPEPSTYAALFGIFALAGVMIRRRLRK